jgi:tetratricopeptide (TPR) repeat protein
LSLLRNNSGHAERVLKYLIDNAVSDSVRVMALYRLADIERESGRFEAALQNYKYALKLCEQINDATTIPYLLHMIGVIHWSQENFDRALHFYEMSLRHYRDLYSSWSEQLVIPGNIVISREDVQRHTANVLRDIGDVHRKTNRLDTANKYLVESLEILKSIEATFETLLTYLSLGRLSRDRQLYTDSIDYYIKALELAQKTETPLFETEALFRLSEAHYLSGHYREAIDWAEKAVDSATTYKFQNMKARALLYWGLAQYMLGDISQSVELLLSALHYANEFSPYILRGVSTEIEKIIPNIEASNEDHAARLRSGINRYNQLIHGLAS